MKAADVFPSKFLRAADLDGRRVTVTISHTTMEKFDDGDRPCVFFKGKDKGLVLNKTNFNALVEITGDEDSDDWVGKRVTLFSTKVDYQGKRVDALRVEAPPKEMVAATASIRRPVPAPAPDPEPNDYDTDEEVPF